MQAVLLASGQNTRVQHVHPGIPKVMFPLGDRPYLDYYIDILFQEAVSELIVVVNHLAHVIENYLSDWPETRSGKIKIIRRRDECGPVGAIVDMENMLKDRFLLFYCDILFKTNLKEAYHTLDNPQFRVCSFLTKDEYKMWDTMEAKIDTDKKTITSFEPGGYGRDEAWMDVGGVYNKSVLEHLKKCPPEEEHINLNIWPELIAKKQLTYHCIGPVFDFGTEKNINTTREIFARKGLDALNEKPPA